MTEAAVLRRFGSIHIKRGHSDFVARWYTSLHASKEKEQKEASEDNYASHGEEGLEKILQKKTSSKEDGFESESPQP